MTVTDILLTGILLYFIWNGYRTGFVMQVVNFVGMFVAYWAAKTYSPTMATWLQAVLGKSSVPSSTEAGLANLGTALAQNVIQSGYGVIAFGLVFITGLLMTRIAGRMIDLVVSLPGLSFINRVSGLLAGLIVGVLILIVAVNLGSYLPAPAIQTAIKNSQVASTLLDTGLSRLLFDNRF
ncbi:CvpA family protein [Effusibacillus consociatus]|uniref:CvpA family protein n=1 Tax=Effusibacillus consociatus TaxID=1117041 RepID=A0ABV9Q2Q7_9BACL